MAKSYYHMRKKQEFASEELEKIRKEFVDIEEPDHDFEGFYYCFEKVLKIIDEHISKLRMR